MEDNELIALLDRKFAEQDQRMEARFAPRFAQIDARFEQIDTRFERMDRRFDTMETKFDDLKIAVGIRLDGMHADIKKIAEGVDTVNEKVDRYHNETMTELIDVRSDLTTSFKILGKRVTDLENRHV